MYHGRRMRSYELALVSTDLRGRIRGLLVPTRPGGLYPSRRRRYCSKYLGWGRHGSISALVFRLTEVDLLQYTPISHPTLTPCQNFSAIVSKPK
jgi:hypothetical protein